MLSIAQLDSQVQPWSFQEEQSLSNISKVTTQQLPYCLEDGEESEPVGCACVEEDDADTEDLAPVNSLKTIFSSIDLEDSNPAWQAKVENLASRGMTLDKILEFYKGLWENMPHFDPSRSTTRDVVRCSVIPLTAGVYNRCISQSRHWNIPSHSSAAEPCAYATQANCSKALLPGIMVTHHWANLFSHTVAAVVADALGESFYSDLVSQLRTADQTGVLIEDLHDKGVLEEVYWLCAFSVNQHCSICGSFDGDTEIDTMLCTTYPLCECGAEKFVSGDHSEMNKFGDMMVHLMNKKSDFRQIVVVDKTFGIFKRAWCVAELVEAKRLGMTQHLKILDPDSVKVHRSDLKRLDISKCEASAPADKEYIMSKVQDVRAFNLHLRHMLLHSEQGLFAKWAEEAGAAAVSIAASYFSEWNGFSHDHMKKLCVASTADPTPIVILSAGTFALPLFVTLVPLDSPEKSWELQFQFIFTTVPYIGFFGLGILGVCWMGLLHNPYGGRVILWQIIGAILCVCILCICGAVVGNFPIPFVQCFMALLLTPFMPLLWWCAPAAQRAESDFVERALCAGGTIFAFVVAFGIASPLLNAAMKHAGTWWQALLLVCYLVIKLGFTQLGETMSRWLGPDTMPIFVFYSTYSYEYNLCQALTGGFEPLHFCELLSFDIIENGYHLWSLYRQGVTIKAGSRQHLGKAQYIVAALLLRELCEVLVPMQFLVQFVLMRKVQPKLNHSVCVTDNEFMKAVLWLCLDISIEVLVGVISCVYLRSVGFEPFKMLRGLVAMNLPVYTAAAGGAATYLSFLQHSHSGADMTFQFLWFGDSRWQCGLAWIAE